ncbi:MAG TPA: RraA family protein [Rhizobium sp.]
MYIVKPLPPQVDKALLDLLVKAEPATIGHFLHTGFMNVNIKSLQRDVRVAGTAVTARAPGPDGSISGYALGQIRPGDILIIDRCGDTKHAIIGGAAVYAAKKAGCAGIIVDGVVTDLGELRAYGLPVWCHGATAITGKALGLGGEFCIPVSCGGVAVSPGDVILADENGVLVLPPEPDLIKESAERAIGLQTAEKTTLARVDRGEKMPDINGVTELVMKNLRA